MGGHSGINIQEVSCEVPSPHVMHEASAGVPGINRRKPSSASCVFTSGRPCSDAAQRDRHARCTPHSSIFSAVILVLLNFFFFQFRSYFFVFRRISFLFWGGSDGAPGLQRMSARGSRRTALALESLPRARSQTPSRTRAAGRGNRVRSLDPPVSGCMPHGRALNNL